MADVELPDGDGRHTCDGLRTEAASQAAHMVAMTGRSDLGDNDFPSPVKAMLPRIVPDSELGRGN
ncbi:hypothetical protein [Caballeronia sp. CLC5]|uniref:hypothetical protein n=1 Tax=Caballeronia sp. CLC5 TaxID=2906764 RepID=UPI001F45862D|nr:hypothetical protein [Caballeronia sp. CLC5]MCE4574835.1 hypothetical protein [Caballeronia sp. CLC5]